MFTSLAFPVFYPISAILWFWHMIFGAAFGPATGVAWALSVFFLVISLRVLLLKPALSGIRSARKMRKLAPQIQKVQEKHKNDRQRMAQEMQKLYSEHHVSPLGGCLPMLVQGLVFLSLLHVLRGFHPGASNNYIFNRQGVQSFVSADFLGARLGNWISQPESMLLTAGTDHVHMLVVGMPLMIAAAVATFFTLRMSLRRQDDALPANPQAAMLGRFMMYVAPLGVVFAGFFFPIPLALLLYYLATNVWALGQQHFLTSKVDREEAAGAGS